MWRRLAVIGVLIAVIGLAIVSRGQLQWSENVAEILPRSAEFIDYTELVRVFRPDNRAFFIVKKSSPATTEEALIDAADRIADGLEQAQNQGRPLFTRVLYRQDIDPMEAVDFYLARQGLYFSGDMAQQVTARLDSLWLGERFAGIRRQLFESPVPGLMRIVARDPLDLSGVRFASLQNLLPTGEKITLHNSRLFAQNLDAILIIADPAGESTDIGQAQAMVDRVNQLVNQTHQSHPDTRVLWLAGQRFSVENASIIKGDVSLVFIVSSLLILLMVWVSLRQLGSLLVLVLPWIFGFSLSFAIVSLTHSSISVIALGMASILAGITIDYGVYVLCLGRQLGDARLAARQLAHPQFIAVATSVIAFIALLFSGITVLQQLGQLAAYWVAGSSAFALIGLPPLLSWLKLLQKPTNTWDIGVGQQKLLELPAKTRMWFLLLLSLLLLPGLGMLQVEDDLQNFNYVGPQTRADYNEIGQWIDMQQKTLYAVVQGTDTQQVLAQNWQLAQKLQVLQEQGLIKQYASIAGLLPPLAIQQENLTRWQQFWSPDRKANFANTLEQAAAAAGMRFPLFLPYLQTLGNEANPRINRDTLPTSLATLVSEHIKISGNQTYILTRIEPAEKKDITASIASIRTTLPGLIVADMGLLRHSTMSLFVNGLLKLSGFVFLLITLFVILFIRDVRRTIAVMLPLILAFFWTFGLLGWLRVKIDASSSIVSVILFGVMIDYSIYITDSIKKRVSLGALPTAITLSLLSTTLGFGCLILARHPVMHACGIATLATTLCGWLAVSLSSFIYKPNPTHPLEK